MQPLVPAHPCEKTLRGARESECDLVGCPARARARHQLLEDGSCLPFLTPLGEQVQLDETGRCCGWDVSDCFTLGGERLRLPQRLFDLAEIGPWVKHWLDIESATSAIPRRRQNSTPSRLQTSAARDPRKLLRASARFA